MLDLPNPVIQPRLNELLPPKRLIELLGMLQENQDSIALQFPGRAKDLTSEVLILAEVGGAKIAFGVAKLNFEESNNSETLEVEHGLGKAPIIVLGMSHLAPAFGKIPICNAFSLLKKTFNINAEIFEAHTGEIGIFWVAIG